MRYFFYKPWFTGFFALPLKPLNSNAGHQKLPGILSTPHSDHQGPDSAQAYLKNDVFVIICLPKTIKDHTRLPLCLDVIYMHAISF